MDQQIAMEKLHEAYDEMFHQQISYEDGPKSGTTEEIYVEAHPGTPIMLGHAQNFIKGEICLGELINFALELQDLYGEGHDLSPTEYPSLKPEVPDFMNQLTYLINSALLGSANKTDTYSIGSIQTYMNSKMDRYYSNYIYELTAEALIDFCNKTPSTIFKNEYYQEWTEKEIENAFKKYPLLLERYKKSQELILERQRIYNKLLPDIKADQEKYKDFDFDSYIKDKFPLIDKKGYFRKSYEMSGYKYFDLIEVYKNNPMLITLISRNYTLEEFEMYKEMDSFNNPYKKFNSAIRSNLFNGKYDECECDFDYFEELLKTSTPDASDSINLFSNESERDEYFSVASECWEKIKKSTIEYGNYATSLSSTGNIKRCLIIFAMLSSKHNGMFIKDDKNNRIFADGSCQNKNGDYNLYTLDTLGSEGASFKSSELNRQRLAFCFKQLILSETLNQSLGQPNCTNALIHKA